MYQDNLTKEELLQRKLKSAMRYAHHVCVIGATNRLEDVKRTNGWSYAQQYRYDYSGRYERSVDHPDERSKVYLCNAQYDAQTNFCFNKDSKWFYRVDDVPAGRFCDTPINLYRVNSEHNPFHDDRFHMYDDTVGIISSAMRAESTRSGNCGVQARLAAKYLWEHHDGIDRIEVVNMDSFDHCFVIVNRRGDLDKSETWGNAWIVDPWAMGGLIYPAKDFLKKISEIKTYVYSEASELFKLGLAYTPGIYGVGEGRKCIAEIRPARDQYPTYDAFHLVNDYYAYNDNRFTPDHHQAGLVASIKKDHHAIKFDDCLQQIKSLKSNPAWCKLFRNTNTHENVDASRQNLHDPTIVKKASK